MRSSILEIHPTGDHGKPLLPPIRPRFSRRRHERYAGYEWIHADADCFASRPTGRGGGGDPLRLVKPWMDLRAISR